MSMNYEPLPPDFRPADPPPAAPDPAVVPLPAGPRAYPPPARSTAAPPRSGDRSRLWAAITVADGLMLLIGALAAVLRLGDLARLPLSAAEAATALANWQFRSAAPLALPVTSPAYFAFTHLIMALGGASDAAARLVPAVFGLLTVLLPWLLRRRARPMLWLVAGLLLAVSPLLVVISRTAGGDAIALFALLLLALALVPPPPGEVRRGSSLSLADSKSPAAGGGPSPLPSPTGRGGQSLSRGIERSAVLMGAALGLGLTSSPLFYTGLIALAPALWLARRADEGDDGPPRWSLAEWRPALVAAAVVFLAVASCWLLRPAGLGDALRLFPAWLSGFGLPPAGDWAGPWLTLLRYEPALLILGLPAAVWAWLAGRRVGRALAAWLAASLLLALLQPVVMVNVAVAVLPGYLLVGLLAAGMAGQRAAYGGAGWRVMLGTAGALVVLGALALAVVGRFARLNLLSGEHASLIGLASLAFVLAALAVLLALAWDNPAARRGAFVGALALLLFWQWGAAWQLSRVGANDPRERWVTAGVDEDVRPMTDLLTRISRQTANSERDLAVFSLVDSPVLAWYLRDLVNFQSGPALPVNSTPDVVISAADDEPPLYTDYYGADFDLMRGEPPAEATTLNDKLRWLLFRESNVAMPMERVIVWIRSDLGRE